MHKLSKKKILRISRQRFKVANSVFRLTLYASVKNVEEKLSSIGVGSPFSFSICSFWWWKSSLKFPVCSAFGVSSFWKSANSASKNTKSRWPDYFEDEKSEKVGQMASSLEQGERYLHPVDRRPLSWKTSLAALSEEPWETNYILLFLPVKKCGRSKGLQKQRNKVSLATRHFESFFLSEPFTIPFLCSLALSSR